MDPILGNIDSLKMNSPDVHTISFSPEPNLKEIDIRGQLEGDIITIDKSNTTVSPDGELNTLNEPIIDTITRDLKAVGNKISNALCPYWAPRFLLMEWDLWGALFFASYIGIVLQQMNSYNPYASQFTQIVLVVFLGTSAVTYSHVVMLRTNTSIFQYISVLGYCLAPLVVNVTLTYLLGFILGSSFWFRLLLFILSTGWAVGAASIILKPDDGPLNIPYHLLPIALYYLTIASMIFYHTHLRPSPDQTTHSKEP